eukprot:402141-Prymnesium_polylepis.1
MADCAFTSSDIWLVIAANGRNPRHRPQTAGVPSAWDPHRLTPLDARSLASCRRPHSLGVRCDL